MTLVLGVGSNRCIASETSALVGRNREERAQQLAKQLQAASELKYTM